MRVLVCGGRKYANADRVFGVLDAMHAETPISLIINGGAPGADFHATRWARARGVLPAVYAADWSAHGKAAGPIRNRRMLAEGKPDVVVAFAGGRGTSDMVWQAREAGVRVIEHD